MTVSPASHELQRATTLQSYSAPRGRERVFRAPLLVQLREGAWPFALFTAIPGVAVVAALIWRHAGPEDSAEAISTALTLLAAMAGPLIALLAKKQRPTEGRTETCSWIALGDGYIRLGMSFLRSKIHFEQIVHLEKGSLTGGRWVPDGQHELGESAEGGASPRPADATRQLSRRRARVRIAMRGDWEVRTVSYPLSIDPLGELTATLETAASRTRDLLGIRAGAADEEVSEALRRLQARFRAERAAKQATVAWEEAAPAEPEPAERGWRLAQPDALPESVERAPVATVERPDRPSLPPPLPPS